MDRRGFVSRVFTVAAVALPGQSPEPVVYGKACSVTPETRGEVGPMIDRIIQGGRDRMCELFAGASADFRGRLEFRVTLVEDEK
jgi:hypothetical protein